MKGFTLVETLVAIVIVILVMGAVTGFITMSYKSYAFTWAQARAIEEARRGIETMIKEIREAKQGDDGSYPIEKAGDKEFIFYSDIDNDGATERVRYFLGTAGGGERTEKCVTFVDGGTCSVSFSNFLEGDLISATVTVSVEGDFGWRREYAEIYGDGVFLGRVCETECSDCAGKWEGTEVFDITSLAQDNSIQFTADASPYVNDFCDWEEPDHAMKVKFELRWEEELSGQNHYFKKGVIDPTPPPITYPSDQEKISILSSFVRNSPPIFEYFDSEGNKIEDYPPRLIDTKVMRVFLIIDVDPEKDPPPFELESSVQLRNLNI